MAHPVDYIPYAMRLRDDQKHAWVAGHYLREVLPPNAPIITSTQGTALSHFTKRRIVRFDGLQPTALDETIAELRRRGYRPVLMLEGDSEVKWFKRISRRLRWRDAIGRRAPSSLIR